LQAFAEAFGVAVVETQAGKGALSWNHPWNAGPVGSNGATSANELAKGADLILALGTRLTDFTTASRTQFQNPAVRFIAINVAPMDASKCSALPVVADVKRALPELSRALKEAGYQGTGHEYRERVAALKGQWDQRVTEIRTVPEGGGALPEVGAIGLINEAVGGKATVVCAAGNMPGELLRLWRPEDPKAYHLEYGFSCMGYEIPGGLGVKLAEPEREVVVMIGDGTYLMMNSEIVTAVAEGLKLTIVVVDNHGYQCILGLQRICGVSDFGNELRFRDPKSGTLTGDYVPIDFVKHAEALGAHAVLAQTAAEVTAAVQEARQRPGVSVVVVPVDPEKRMPSLGTWWDVPVAEVSAVEKTRQTRENYEKATQKQRPVFA
jgi:3D-(3,5/4)-trihydroxycyclohexane-1,2-dione acylhydrolase (decyclizing)